jgi:hypothetical protein
METTGILMHISMQNNPVYIYGTGNCNDVKE